MSDEVLTPAPLRGSRLSSPSLRISPSRGLSLHRPVSSRLAPSSSGRQVGVVGRDRNLLSSLSVFWILDPGSFGGDEGLVGFFRTSLPSVSAGGVEVQTRTPQGSGRVRGQPSSRPRKGLLPLLHRDVHCRTLSGPTWRREVLTQTSTFVPSLMCPTNRFDAGEVMVGVFIYGV